MKSTVTHTPTIIIHGKKGNKYIVNIQHILYCAWDLNTGYTVHLRGGEVLCVEDDLSTISRKIKEASKIVTEVVEEDKNSNEENFK